MLHLWKPGRAKSLADSKCVSSSNHANDSESGRLLGEVTWIGFGIFCDFGVVLIFLLVLVVISYYDLTQSNITL